MQNDNGDTEYEDDSVAGPNESASGSLHGRRKEDSPQSLGSQPSSATSPASSASQKTSRTCGHLHASAPEAERTSGPRAPAPARGQPTRWGGPRPGDPTIDAPA